MFYYISQFIIIYQNSLLFKFVSLSTDYHFENSVDVVFGSLVILFCFNGCSDIMWML